VPSSGELVDPPGTPWEQALLLQLAGMCGRPGALPGCRGIGGEVVGSVLKLELWLCCGSAGSA
jgi:hypothetical protein